MSDDLVTPEDVAWVRSQRVTEVEEEYCRVPGAADDGICAYAGPDGKDGCGLKCVWRGV